jgi:RHS repeat-associated protein
MYATSNDAIGRKLSQIVYAASNVQQKRTDYAGEFVYEGTTGNTTLQFINHEEGRIIPGSPLEYQYHIKDHLGNVRVTFTTKLVTESPVATFEAANEIQELGNFLRPENVRKVQYYAFDHTNGGAPTTTTGYAERLSGGTNERYGLARSISVMPGDKITAEVFAKYIDPVSGNRTGALNSFLTQVASLISAGTTSSGTVKDGGQFSSSTSSFPFPTQAGSITASSTESGPKAYLNWLVFDRDYNLILSKSNFDRLSATPKEIGQDVAHERLFSPEITIDVAGYVYIFLSNEEATPVDVYFDDFKVTQVKSPVVQMDDYYPFGLAFNSYSRENSIPNQFKFNGKEQQDELNLLTYDYGARMYDPALGKWWQVDPLSEKYQSWSPYAYVMNNPLKFMDPTGMFSTHTNEEGEVVAVYDDGDNGVYKHEKNADGGSVTKAQIDKRHKKSTSGGGEKMGETEYWDEFINPGSGEAEGTIFFGESQSWDPLIEWGNEKATNQDLMITKKESENHGVLDIKENKDWAPGGHMDGRLLNGKYATARSAGNYLAGMNGVTGTFQGEHISGETYMKLAGAYQQKELSYVNAALIVTTGMSFGPAPYYGEETYSGRRIQEGINAGNKKLKK